MTVDLVDKHGFVPEVAYCHKADLDGLVCALIARARFPEVRIVPLDYDELDQALEVPALVLDLNLPLDTLQRGPLWVVDHHLAPWYPPGWSDPPQEEYRSCQPSGIDENTWLFHHPERCAALIALDVLFPGRKQEPEVAELGHWAMAADAADRWLEEHALFRTARALTSVVRQSGFEFAVDAWAGLSIQSEWVTAMAEAGAAADKRLNTAAIQAAIATSEDVGDHVLGICVAGSISHVAQGVLKFRKSACLPTLPVALIILGSLLSDTDQVSVGVRGPGALAIAQRYGGGGHPESAGFELPRVGIVGPMISNLRLLELLSEVGRSGKAAEGLGGLSL